MKGDFEIVYMMVKAGADVNDAKNSYTRYDSSPLSYAMYNETPDKEKIIAYLLHLGANPGYAGLDMVLYEMFPHEEYDFSGCCE